MALITLSRQTKDFIDAADIGGNIKNSDPIKRYLAIVDTAIEKIGRDKFKAVYPFVGGVEGSHKYNLIDPRDLDVAFRLTFQTGWVHSSIGAKNNSSSYARTYLIPSTHLTQDSTHLSFAGYDNTGSNGVVLGCQMSSSQKMSLTPAFNLLECVSDQYNISTGRATGTRTTAKGMLIGSRNTSNSHHITFNMGQGRSTATPSGTIPSIELYLGGLNINGSLNSPSVANFTFASIGSGITAKEALFFQHQIDYCQRMLGRGI